MAHGANTTCERRYDMQIIHAHVNADLSMNHVVIHRPDPSSCDTCGEMTSTDDLCDYTDTDLGMICEECAESWVRCDDCNAILNSSYDIVRAPHSEFDDAFAVCETCYDERDAAIQSGADIHNPRNLP